MSHLQGPVTVSDQAHRMITILSRETDTALEDIELRGQSHLKWLEDITQASLFGPVKKNKRRVCRDDSALCTHCFFFTPFCYSEIVV